MPLHYLFADQHKFVLANIWAKVRALFSFTVSYTIYICVKSHQNNQPIFIEAAWATIKTDKTTKRNVNAG